MKFKYDVNKNKLIVSESTKLEYNQCQLWLKRHVKNYKYTPAYKRYRRTGVGWDGKIDHFHKGTINIGLWKECLKACYEIGAPFEIENKHEFPINRNIKHSDVEEFCNYFFKNHKVKKDDKWVDFKPREYQIKAAYAVLKNRYCIAQVATSGGKSLIISIVIFYILSNIDPDAKFLLITPSISLVTQFYDDIIDYNIGENKENKNPVELRVEEIMSDKPRKHSGVKNPNLYIGCYQSLVDKDKWDVKWFSQFHTVIVDESHSCKSKSLVSILERTFKTAYNRFGVSGTFPSESSCESLTIQSVLGPQVVKVEAEKLIKEGNISSIKINMMYINHDDVDFEYKINQIRKNPDRGRDAYELEKKYIQASNKRLDFILKLIKKCNKNTLLLFHNIEYGKKILEKLKDEIEDKEFYYIDGEVKSKDRDIIKNKMEESEGNVKILLATFGCLSTGVSIKNLHYLILAESFKSEIRIIQSLGRSMRLHHDKHKAIIFDLVDVYRDEDPKNIFHRHGEERKRHYNKHKYPYQEIKYDL